MSLSVTSKVGKLEITDDGFVRTTKLFGGAVVWQFPANTITEVSAKPGSIATVTITFQTSQGIFTAETVSKPNFEKVQTALGVGATILPATRKPRHWYEDEALRDHVETYDNTKAMAKDIELLSRHGWIPQNQLTQGGHISGRKVIGGAIVGGVLTGGIGTALGAFAGAKRGKEKIT